MALSPSESNWCNVHSSAPKNSVKMLPLELVEKILSFCDGKTLLTALDVDDDFKNRVRYLTTHTDIWKSCCHEEIPANEMLEYLDKFSYQSGREKWLQIYETWFQWKDIRNVKFYFTGCPVEIPRITCLAALGRLIAVGSEDGRIRVFNTSWELLGIHRYSSGKVSDIKFLTGGDKGGAVHGTLMLVAYNIGSTIYISNTVSNMSEPFLTYHDVLQFSVYKNLVCVVRRGGRISIDKLSYPVSSTELKAELVYVRIYAQNEVTRCNIWKGVCTFLVHNEVKTVKYDKEVVPLSMVENNVSLRYFRNSNDVTTKCTYLFRDDLLIVLTQDPEHDEVMEVFCLQDNKTGYLKKSFNSWSILNAVITYVYVYGNTLLIGDNCGMVYFYEVDSWKRFDLSDHKKQIYLGPHPIIWIDAIETVDSRVYYVASSYRIHIIECSIVSKYSM